jgi:AcrR family transcriptional regulator
VGIPLLAVVDASYPSHYWTCAQYGPTLRAMKRMTPDARRDAIVDAAVRVAVDKGLASTTVRDVAAAMGTSSGLIHHYFASMDDVLAAAFDRVARQDLTISEQQMAAAPSPTEALRSFFGTYTPADKDWAFQLWLDAWAEAARRPAVQATSRRLNLAWQGLLEATIRAGVADGSFRSDDPRGAAWRILSLLDGLALQVVAHGTTVTRADVVGWTASYAERELGLEAGSLGATVRA